MRKSLFLLVIMVVISIYQSFGGIKPRPMDPKLYVGNVLGIVTDKETGKPIQGALIYLLNNSNSIEKDVKDIDDQQAFSKTKYNQKRISDSLGKFLINFVPTPDSGRTYSLIVKSKDGRSKLFKDFFVPPGASNSPYIPVVLEQKLNMIILTGFELHTIIKYGQYPSLFKRNDHLNTPNLFKKKNPNGITSIKASILATQEGLVGGTTSNQHVVQPNDHFVALPSGTVVCSSDQTSEYNVTLYYGDNVIYSVPVWDTGPLNWYDNYWDPESQRVIYQHLHYGGQSGLGQYVPEGEAAVNTGYNQGYSGDGGGYSQGQYLANHQPAGIDLADGTHSDLGFSNNESGYIGLVFNWQNTNSVINEDIKQTAHWFGSVAIEVKGDGNTDIHIMNNQTIEVDPGCTLTLNSFVRLKIDAGSTLILDNGMIKNFSVGAGIDVAPGGHFIDNTITGICNTCPPYAPTNFSATIVGQNVILTWNTYTDQSAWGLQVYKNGQYYGDWLPTSQTSYTDVNSVSSLPATYKICAFNDYGSSYSQPINVIVSPSTISSNTPWNGVVFVNSNITVSPNAQLTIEPNTKIIFNSGFNYNLTVSGTLTVQGISGYPAIFTSNSATPSAGNWGTITLGSGASGSNLQYANIQYGTEIDVNTSNISIQNCNITNSSMHGINFISGTGSSVTNNTITNTNTAHGIYVTNSASVTCSGNVITRTNSNHNGVGIYFGGGGTGIAAQNDISGFSVGIGATWGSSPTSYNGTYTKNNRITNCSIGLDVYRNSFPIFGTSSAGDRYGGNSINNNLTNQLNVSVGISYPTYSSGLSACSNWWGHTPPYTSLFSVGSSAYFYYNNYLSSDPWGNQQQFAIKQILGSSTVDGVQYTTLAGAYNNATGSSNDLDSLFIGTVLMDGHNVKEAKDFFLSYLEKHPDNQAAYTYLYNCADSSTTPEIISFFNSLPSKASKEQKLLLSYLYLRQGNIKLAKNVNDKIANENPNTSLGVRANLNNFYIALYNDNDIITATMLLNEVKAQADLSTPMEIVSAEDALSVYSSVISAGSAPVSPKQVSDIIEKPTSYSLSQNYPNPFNPTTTIKYQIPISGFVTLKIYDILGKEVAALVKENKDQGFYNVSFDASKLASGVYIYQLKVNDYISSKKMMLLK